jgi:protein-tyrosine phosphatase
VIDTHCHLLPFLDDGAADWDAALAMARTAYADGIRQCVATPHWTGARGEAEKTLETLNELRRRLTDEGLHLKLFEGNEVILVPKLVEALRERRAFTLAGSSYVLLETAQLEHGAYIHAALFQLQSSGYRVILAHPERVLSWQAGLNDLRDLIHRGCRLQVNAGSLLGQFGPGARKTAERLIRRGWVSLLATDAHSPTTRAPLLAEARNRCARLIGDAAAEELVDENPARVLCDEELPHLDPDAAPPPLFRLPWMR